MVELSLAELQNAAPRVAETAAKPDASAARKASEAASVIKEKAAEVASTVRETQKAVEQKNEQAITERQKDALKQAFEGLDDTMSKFNKAISFAVFEESGEMYAQVVNTQTKEVIKTFPSEEMLSVMSRISDSIGMLIDEQG